MIKAEFSASSLQSSEIIIICWFAAQEIFLIIINVENSCAAAASYFLWKLWYISFSYLLIYN